MNEKQPEPQDFGITSEEYNLYYGLEDLSGRLNLIVGSAVFLGLFVYLYFFVDSLNLGASLGYAFFLVFLLFLPIIWLTKFVITRYHRYRLLKTNVASQIELYYEAWTAYETTREEAERAQRESEREAERVRLETERARREADRPRREAEKARLETERTKRRKLREYWMSLDGLEFEQELGEVFKRLGYTVQSTPRTGDQGIDIILRKDGKTTIVQCKSHQSPVGPAVARELYGSMRATKADGAILACTGGFTRGVKQFAQGKPINLISAAELAKMGERVEHTRIEYVDKSGPANPPTCPVRGCGEKMTLKTGRFGKLWGCPEWPLCRGTREYRVASTWR